MKLPATQDLARDWRAAVAAVTAAKKNLVAAQEHARARETDLAKSIAPKDLRDGEQIGVWVWFADHEERLIVVRKDSVSGLSLEERQ